MNKWLLLFEVMRKGQAVANPEAWKKGQIGATVVGGAIMAVAQFAAAFGYPVPIPEDIAMMIGGGIVTIANFFLTYATSEKVGILPAKD